jgi:outer membrane protein assembly factor BamB
VEWVANIPGREWSSPIVTSGKVFLTTAVTEGKSKLPQTGTTYSTDYLRELKAKGLKDEEAEAKLIERHRKASFTSETPISDGNAVYVYIGNLGLWAFDLRGKLLWSEKLEAYPMYGDCGSGASSALAGDQLIIFSDNEKQQFIASYDKRSGKRLWRTGRDLKVAVPSAARNFGCYVPPVFPPLPIRFWNRRINGFRCRAR